MIDYSQEVSFCDIRGSVVFDSRKNKCNSYSIEAPSEAIFYATTGKLNKVLDVSDPAVIAYTDLFRETGSCFISDGESLEYLLEGRKVSSKSGLRSR